MITVALCEDNDIQRDIMLNTLMDYSDSHRELSVSTFATGRDLLRYIREKGGFDIYILDIIMPDINGMELAATLRLMKDRGLIIFTTATVEYAAASYDVDAFYYMLKPIDTVKFFKILDKATATFEDDSEVFEVKTKAGYVRLKHDSIMYVEAVDRALRFYMKDGRTCNSLMLRGSFREAVAPLLKNPAFCTCGVSKLINLKYVDAVDSDSVMLSDGTQIYPPRSAYTEFRRMWKDYMNR